MDGAVYAQPLFLPALDRAGLATRFVFPVVVNGRVYFATRGEVEVYGLLN